MDVSFADNDAVNQIVHTDSELAALNDAERAYNNAVFASLPLVLRHAFLDAKTKSEPVEAKSGSLSSLVNATGKDAKGSKLQVNGKGSLLSASERVELQAHLEDAIDQLSILENIGASNSSDKLLTKKLSDQVSQLLNHQKLLEIKYQKVSEETNVYRQIASKQKYKVKQAILGTLASELQQNNQTLAKTLRNYPSAIQNTCKLQLERSNLMSLLKKTQRELKLAPAKAAATSGESAVPADEPRPCKLEDLWHVVQAEYTQRHAVAATLIRESESTRTIQELQQQVEEEKRLMFKELQDRSFVIQQLKDTIQEIHALTESEKLYVKKQLKAHETQVGQENQQLQDSLQNEREQSALALQQENCVHKSIGDFLAETFSELEKKIQDWMQKYEEDVERKTNELETLKQRRTNDLDSFEEMLTKCEELEKFVEAHRAEEARVQKERQVEYQRESAAIVIQAWYRRILKKRGGLKRKGASKKKAAGNGKKAKK